MRDYGALNLTIADSVATIAMHSPIDLPIQHPHNVHVELAHVFNDLREDHSVRVIVLTGARDSFFVVRPPESYHDPVQRRSRTDPARMWESFSSTALMHEQMALIEKPIVAKVNGDAIGFGSTLVFACDFIIARDDATIIDTHMGMGETPNIGPDDFGLVPGDGGTALIPLFLSPPLAKEYLMLGRAYTGAELAQMGVINYAVPAADLDDCVSDFVRRLLLRSAYALAWTKRTANRQVVAQVTSALDAGLAYEMVTFHQWERLGWTDTKHFDGTPTAPE